MAEAHRDGSVDQRAEITGHGNRTVQIVGDHNQVIMGCAEFRITRYPRERGRTGGAAFLAPYARAIRTVGREDERRALHEWLSSSKPIVGGRLVDAGCSVSSTIGYPGARHLPCLSP